jgi:hypothetical protein
MHEGMLKSTENESRRAAAILRLILESIREFRIAGVTSVTAA